MRPAATLVVLVGLFGAAPTAVPAQPGPAAGCQLLDAAVRARFEPGAQVEILLAAGNTVPAGLRDTYREMAVTVLSCLGEGARVELLPITDSSYGVAPAFSGTIAPSPPGNTNPLWGHNERGKLMNAGSTAIDSVLATPHKYDGFDPLGALHAAGEALHRGATRTKLIAVVIGNGWQQTKHVNLFRYGHNPAQHAADVIRSLKADRTLPNLANTDVFIVGVTRGDRRLNMSEREIQGLCDFWGAVIRAAGGTKVLHDCPTTLPGLTLPMR
jgi:hypothetical protein